MSRRNFHQAGDEQDHCCWFIGGSHKQATKNLDAVFRSISCSWRLFNAPIDIITGDFFHTKCDSRCCFFCPGMCRRWPLQPACLQWSSITPRCHPRCPPSRSPRQTQATPSPCPPPLLPTTEMMICPCYDAQMYVGKHRYTHVQWCWYAVCYIIIHYQWILRKDQSSNK